MSSPTSAHKKALRPSASLFEWCARAASCAALLSFLVVMWQNVLRNSIADKPGWPEAILVITTAFATLTSMTRQLAGQNVMLAATIVGAVGGTAHAIGAITGIPFGPFSYSNSAGPKFFDTLAWPMPVIWIIVIFNARGVARLMLKPWRKLKNYGFWVIGVTGVLVFLFDLALEPFATRVHGYWIWMPTKFPWNWNGMPLINAFSWALIAVLALAFATPSLINKHSRSKKFPLQLHPLFVWVLLLALFATGTGLHSLWSAMWLAIGTAVLSIVFAIRGLNW